ncbi:MAG: hypothetical protein GY940_12390 [bacterium]|nr:hypothetical protein [bacterium]
MSIYYDGPIDAQNTDCLPIYFQFLFDHFKVRLDERDEFEIRVLFDFYFDSKTLLNMLIYCNYKEFEKNIDHRLRIFLAHLGFINQKINRLIMKSEESLDSLINKFNDLIIFKLNDSIRLNETCPIMKADFNSDTTKKDN